MYGTIALTDNGYAYNGNSLIFHDHPGFGFGGFYAFPTASRFAFGVDARGSFSPGTTGGAKGFVSARAAFVPRQNPLRPYFQIGVGEIHARVPAFSYTVGATTINKFGLDLALGLDLRLTSSFDYRIVELESGAGFDTRASEAGSASLSTGVVYHFPSARKP